MNPIVLTSITELRTFLKSKGVSQRIGFVPTMGALHIGHLSLVELAAKHSDSVGVSIFVNPTQFLPGEDFLQYPRNLDADLEKLSGTACEWVFVPEVAEIYPPGADTRVDPGWIGTILEGAFRPGHFTGVATVVTRLLQIVEPDIAVFGQKDAQQCAVIKKIVRDLSLSPEIIIGATIRETDGLAYSSRNQYLSIEERKRACGLFQTLQAGIRALAGGDDILSAERKMFAYIQSFQPDRIDYLTFIDDESFLSPTASKPVRALGAVRFGTTRLIDNLSLIEI